MPLEGVNEEDRAYPLYQGKPDSGAWKLPGVVQTLKYTEQLGQIARIKARTIVPNEIVARHSCSLPNLEAIALAKTP